MPEVTVIGMGLSVADLTPAHWERIRSADIVMGAERYLAQLEKDAAACVPLTGDMDAALDLIRRHKDQWRIVVLASGDPLFFGIGELIVHALGPKHVMVMPNISTVAAAFARLKMPWGQAPVISLHGRDNLISLLAALKKRSPTAVLTDHRRTPDWLAAQLLENGFEDWRMAVFQQMGSAGQRFERYSLAQAAEKRFAQPNIVVLLPSGRGHVSSAPGARLGLGCDEADFEHEAGLITKSEVRAVTLSRLKLQPGQILWDLGAASGAVGLEASLLLGDGWIMAVEKHPARVKQIRANAAKFGVENLSAIQADLPDGVDALPEPDRVFIGGGGQDLGAIVTAAARRLKPGGVMVANTVLLANLQAAVQAMEQNAMSVDVVQIQVSRSKPMAWSQRFEAHNPVWIIRGSNKA